MTVIGRGRVLSSLLACGSLSLCAGWSRAAFLSSRPSPSFIVTAVGSTPALRSRSPPLLLSGGEFATPSAGGKEPSAYGGVDGTALAKYSVGLAAQMSLLFGFLSSIDAALIRFPVGVPFAANVAFMYAFSLKSSLFSILPSSRVEGRKITDEDKGTQEYNKRNVPKWTPPGIAFVFGWPLLTFGLRAVTGAMVIRASGGRYATTAIMSLMLHFSVGNLWNTVCVSLCALTVHGFALCMYEYGPFADVDLVVLLSNLVANRAGATWSDAWESPCCSSTRCG